MPAVTAVFVILTALSGSVIGPMVIRYFRIDNEIARGVLLGTSAHGAGINAVDRIAIQQPTVTLIMISTAYFFKTGKYLYSGIAKATVAGWSMSVNKRPPACVNLSGRKSGVFTPSKGVCVTFIGHAGDTCRPAAFHQRAL